MTQKYTRTCINTRLITRRFCFRAATARDVGGGGILNGIMIKETDKTIVIDADKGFLGFWLRYKCV